jgi:hypothetical protein
MYNVTVQMENNEYIRNEHFVEFMGLAEVFTFIQEFEKHSKYSCSYVIEFVK